MKTCLVIILALVAVACAQHGRNVDPRTAAILAEARYLSGDGSFGSAYVQEDGTDFKEETDADGTRKGQYSYLDPQGKKITVSYTAGKNGFQVSGDHLPKAPAPLPAQPQAAPVPQYNPAPRYNAIPQTNYNNFNNFNQYNPNSPQDTPEVAQAKAEHFRAYSAALARAGDNANSQHNPNDDGQYREEYNQPQQQQQQQQYYQQPQQPYNHYQQPQFAPIQVTTTTPPPSRFFPPGKLNLNRTPDGFQYSFASSQ